MEQAQNSLGYYLNNEDMNIKAFMAADEAVRGLNDHDSEIDTKIAAAIDEHLRAIDRLCRFGIDGGFGEEHPVKEY